MGKTLSFLVILAGSLLSGQPLESQEFPLTGGNAYQVFLRTIYDRLERFAALSLPSKMTFLADGSDGGGDGSGTGTGGSGDGGTDGGNGGTDGTGGDGGTDGGTDGTDGGESDSASNGAADAAAATSDAAAAASDDAATAAAAATSDDAATAATSDDAAAAAVATTTDAAAVAATTTATDNADPDTTTTDPTTLAQAPTTDLSTIAAPTTDPANPVSNPTDPTNPPAINQAVDPTDQDNAVTAELSAIEDIAITDPRGGSAPNDFTALGVAELGPGVAKVSGSAEAPVDVAINAVIVSAAQSPWDAVRKAPGVGNVIVTGGIIALGKTPIDGEIPGGGPQPAWLRLIPDLRLLNGSIIPPVVPNVIDIRILNCPMKIVDPPQGG